MYISTSILKEYITTNNGNKTLLSKYAKDYQAVVPTTACDSLCLDEHGYFIVSGYPTNNLIKNRTFTNQVLIRRNAKTKNKKFDNIILI